MEKWNLQVFVPLADNDNRATPDRVFAHVARELCRIGGGTCETIASGSWIGPGRKLFRDSVRIIETDAEGERDALYAELCELAAYVKTTCRQHAVYVRLRPAGIAEAI